MTNYTIKEKQALKVMYQAYKLNKLSKDCWSAVEILQRGVETNPSGMGAILKSLIRKGSVKLAVRPTHSKSGFYKLTEQGKNDVLSFLGDS